eukprot:80124_1
MSTKLAAPKTFNQLRLGVQFAVANFAMYQGHSAKCQNEQIWQNHFNAQIAAKTAEIAAAQTAAKALLPKPEISELVPEELHDVVRQIRGD